MIERFRVVPVRQPLDLATLTAWHDYEARNRRANTDYRVHPSVVPELIASIEHRGLNVTCGRFKLPPGAIVGWFPECFERTSGAPDA